MLPLPGGEKFLGPDGALAFLENKSIDARIEARGPITPPIDITYVDVDSLSISKLGNFPWNRRTFAETLEALFTHGRIKAAGMDFVFSSAGLPALGREEAESGSRALGKAIHTHRNVVLAATYGSQNRQHGDTTSFPFVFEKRHGEVPVGPPELPSFPVVGPTWGHIGLIDTVDEDVRYVPFHATTPHHTYFPMSLQLALIHWGLDQSHVEILDDSLVVKDAAGDTLRTIPLRMGQLAESNWFSPWMGADSSNASLVAVLAFAQLLEQGTPEQQQEAREFFAQFEDDIVLIGPVDPLLKDLSPMPLSGPAPVPRVSLHGNLLGTILSDRFIHRPPLWANVAIIFALGIGAASFGLVPSRFATAAKIAATLLVAGYSASSLWLFSTHDLIVPLVAPLGASISCVFAAALIELSSETRQKRRITAMFGTYLSPALVNTMVESGEEPQLGGMDAEITAFFSDVQSFSTFSEILTPQQLVALMNEYLSAMTDILMEEGCFVDKFIGDAIVGIFNAPAPLENHALKACTASCKLHARLADLRTHWASQGDKWPPFVHRMQMRIGLNTGFATVGNMGSTRRFNYTMMGDTVNLAARCESGAKSYGAYTMVTGETRNAALAAADTCLFRELDLIVVKGRSEPASIHEVVGLRHQLPADTLECVHLYEQALALHRAQQWREALALFEKAATLESNRKALNPDAPTTPSEVMIARTLELEKNPPPADWNGVHIMRTK
jgi:adenylate cyclase